MSMGISTSILTGGRYASVLLVIAGSLALTGAPRRPFGIHDKEYYVDPMTLQFIRPGLAINIVSATIANDGTISVDYKLSDPKGMALDISGITTPGPISVSFLAAYIPKGQEQYVSYITRNETDTVTGSGRTTVEATADSGGTTQTVAVGEYIYTFKNKAPAGFDPTATHRIGIYGSRNLTEFDLGTNYDDATFDFAPAGGTPAPRDVVRTADCNKCHDSLAAHGGSRKSVELCIMCHTPQTTDAETNNTLDFKVFIHKLHDGSGLPSVQSGTPYQIVGYQNAVNDWSTVEYPADVRRCQTCHNPKNGAAQTSAWLQEPTRAACGSCHDNVNFATGQNHSGNNLPEVSDNQCAGCHIPQGQLPFDASIIGAHTIQDEAPGVPGLNFTLTKVVNGGPGQTPTVTFTVRDNAGNGIPMSTFTANSGSLSLTMVGPTSDYGYTNFGVSSTPGYVTESVIKTASCSPDGTCSYTFTHAVPANATGTYAIGIEGRLSTTLLATTTTPVTTSYGGTNQVIYFSVDGTPVQPRRTVVLMQNCNNCHSYLEVHGGLRNNVTYCPICHNPSNSDFTTRPSATVAAQQGLPPQAINFALMIHKIHTGANLEANFKQTYIVVGHGGSESDFGAAFASVPASIPNTGVRYPTMGPTGTTGDTAKCYMCHAQTPAPTEGILPIGMNNVTDPQGLLNPAPATTSACTACHLDKSAFAHANLNTDPKFGESCDVCHATGAQFDVDQVHAGK
jgi:OmcA/MtrC family decaheme c-type cytochrome